MTLTNSSPDRVLNIYLALTQYPVLASRIRERMRSELFSRGIILPEAFEVEVRKNLILDGLKLHDELKDKLSKIKPDVLTYDAEGKVSSENFSKAKVDEKLKLEKQFKEIETALNLASDKGDYKKLQKK